MTTIAFIRHGITSWNEEGRTQGSIDIPLSKSGIQMAKEVSARFVSEEWQAIYTSPMKRAQMTANIIASTLKQSCVIEDERIREIFEGEIEGTTEKERIQMWGESWRSLPLGIEHERDVLNRGISFLEDIKVKYPDGKVLVISHGSFIQKIIQHLIPTESFNEIPSNTSISIITLKEVNHCCVYDCMRLNEPSNCN